MLKLVTVLWMMLGLSLTLSCKNHHQDTTDLATVRISKGNFGSEYKKATLVIYEDNKTTRVVNKIGQTIPESGAAEGEIASEKLKKGTPYFFHLVIYKSVESDGYSTAKCKSTTTINSRKFQRTTPRLVGTEYKVYLDLCNGSGGQVTTEMDADVDVTVVTRLMVGNKEMTYRHGDTTLSKATAKAQCGTPGLPNHTDLKAFYDHLAANYTSLTSAQKVFLKNFADATSPKAFYLDGSTTRCSIDGAVEATTNPCTTTKHLICNKGALTSSTGTTTTFTCKDSGVTAPTGTQSETDSGIKCRDQETVTGETVHEDLKIVGLFSKTVSNNRRLVAKIKNEGDTSLTCTFKMTAKFVWKAASKPSGADTYCTMISDPDATAKTMAAGASLTIETDEKASANTQLCPVAGTLWKEDSTESSSIVEAECSSTDYGVKGYTLDP